jgi:hypothetical protein
MEREVDADTAAQILGTLSQNPIGAIRGMIEAAIAMAAPAQRKLGRIADGEVPSDPEVLREACRDLDVARQLLETATKALRVAIENGENGVRPTSPGGNA